jgi:hypothetical protein
MLPEVPLEGFWYFVGLILAMIFWRIWGHRIVGALRRFDQRRRDADLQAYVDRMNPNAHFRQSVEQINDDTPPVEPVGSSGDGATWKGKVFATREEAEAERWRQVLTQARDFYRDLDRTYGNRISGRNSKDTLGGNSGD